MALCGLALTGCGEGGEHEPPPAPAKIADGPPIVLISIDTLRADHLSCYGADRPTPHIDSLAAEGVRYAAAHSCAPWTLPSHGTLLSGRRPSSHGLIDDGVAFADDTILLAEALGRIGYRRAGFVAHYYLDTEFGFDRGFETYERHQYETGRSTPPVRGDVVVRRALEWWSETADDPRPPFLFVHLFDPHWDYAPPPPFAGRYSDPTYRGPINGTLDQLLSHLKERLPDADLRQLIALYDEEVAWTDELVGRLVDGIRARPGGEDVVFVLTADHGEEFYEHGSLGHATTLYREQTHVPLIVSDPAGGKGQVVDTPVSLVDLSPSLAELAGVDAEAPFRQIAEGRPLGWRSPPHEVAARPLVAETTRWGPARSAVQFRDRKAIQPMRYHWFARTGPQRELRTFGSWKRGAESFAIDVDPLETSERAWDPEQDVSRFLEHWREQQWKGVMLHLWARPGLAFTLDLPRGAAWIDEPVADDGRALVPIILDDAGLRVANPPAGRWIRLHLPLDPTALGALRGSVQSGSLLWQGSGEESPPRATFTRPLAGRALAEPRDAPTDASASIVVLRWRPIRGPVEREVDEATRRLLDKLGYSESD